MSRRNGLVCILIHPLHHVRDANGKTWWFEMHPYCGPQPLSKKNGDPIRVPEDSPFWPAFERWHAKQPRDQAAADIPELGIKP